MQFRGPQALPQRKRFGRGSVRMHPSSFHACCDKITKPYRCAMMTHEVRGDARGTPTGTSNRRREEERISHSFRRHLHQTLGWMCTVFIASTVLCIGELRAALDLARQRGYEAAKFTTSEGASWRFRRRGLERPEACASTKRRVQYAARVCSTSRVL